MTRAAKAAALALAISFLTAQAGCGRAGNGDGADEASVYSAELLNAKETVYKTETLACRELVRTAELEADQSFVFSKTVSTGSKDCVISELRASRNQPVKKGDVLAVLRGTGSESDVKELRLQIEYYKASCEETEEKLATLVEAAASESAENSFDEEIIELKVKKAQAAYDAYVLKAEFELKNMMSQLEEKEAELKDVYLYSPIDGVVKSVASGYKPGDMIKAHTPLYVINYTGAVLYYASSTSGPFVYNRDVTMKVGRGEKQLTVKGRVVSSPEVMPDGVYTGGVFVEANPEDLKYGADHATMSVEYTMMKDALIVDKSAL
jgi:multidrug efflux pump subunit AcrA (membrane-fusion protein)